MPRSNAIQNWVGAFGGGLIAKLENFGRFWLFCAATSSYIAIDLFSLRGWKRLLPQCYFVGTRSVPVIMLTGMFVGMVLLVQGFEQFDNAGLLFQVGGIVNISVASELGPVLAGVMLAGRVGGALTAELGTMNVTEQLLALRSMGAAPIRYLATPRFLACLLLSPLLTCYANIMGALGAWVIFAFVKGAESSIFWGSTQELVENWDLWTGLIKAVFFGGAIGMISCYKGFYCKPGAEGVGQACTQSFVASFITILALDLFLNMIMSGLYVMWYGFRSLI